VALVSWGSGKDCCIWTIPLLGVHHLFVLIVSGLDSLVVGIDDLQAAQLLIGGPVVATLRVGAGHAHQNRLYAGDGLLFLLVGRWADINRAIIGLLVKFLRGLKVVALARGVGLRQGILHGLPHGFTTDGHLDGVLGGGGASSPGLCLQQRHGGE